MKSRHLSCFAGLAGGLLLAVAGCGAGKYESRLKNNTIPYFQYEQTLDENLASEWSSQGIRIRVPEQFERIPAPPRDDESESEGGPVRPEDDPRQPDYISGELPGLVAAWRADVDVLEADYRVPAFIYVLSNYEMWRDPEIGKEAFEFNTTAAQALTEGLGVPFPAESQWNPIEYPRNEAYVPSKSFLTATPTTTVSLPVTVPSEGRDSDDDRDPRRRREDVPVDCLICLHEAGDIRVTLVFVIPRQVAAGEKLDLDSRTSRVALCLETLSVSSRKPKGPRESRSAGF